MGAGAHSACIVGKKQGEGVSFRVGGQLIKDAFQMLFGLGMMFFQCVEHPH